MPTQIERRRRHATPIRCELCAATAPLAEVAVRETESGTKEVLTYRCEACGEAMVRYVVSL
jgi:predicted SprT family Zn-dependent metalloprotease